ncbi:hypothetical protein H6A18_03785 [Collinsella tanakaei]|uniref:hypothetical protein n=1 Tax=Collinsella tanakaei TaxID=626935 RepID=UPI001959112D|nr:hypothetical protein [Collinsella tanakaei]MBM6755645.1 hypothetical protein [Collinsella tanakaei]
MLLSDVGCCRHGVFITIVNGRVACRRQCGLVPCGLVCMIAAVTRGFRVVALGCLFLFGSWFAVLGVIGWRRAAASVLGRMRRGQGNAG